MDVVEAVLSTPVAIDAARVPEAVPGRAAHVGDEDGEALEREDLDQRHREPREVRALLTLRPAVHVVHERARPVVAELRRRQIEARRDTQSVVRLERRVLP